MTKEKVTRATKQTTLTNEIKRNNKIIYSLKLRCPKTKDPMKTMQDKLRKWFKEMNKCSPSFIVYKWKDETFSKAITCLDSISSNIYEMKHYFNRISPVVEEGDMWCSIHAGHDEEAEDIRENTAWWFKHKRSGMYKKNLQFHKTATPNWLLWSHERIDTKALLSEIEARAEKLYGVKIPMALRFTYIKDGGPWKKRTTQEGLKGLHVECPKDKVEKVKKLMSFTYSYNLTKHPLGIRMRYVTLLEGNITTNTKNEVLRLRTKQEWYLNSISHVVSMDIKPGQLDYTNSKGFNLRNELMKIKTKDKKNNLFLSIGKSWDGGHTFTFPKQFEDDANDMIAGFGTFLYKKHSTDVIECLNEEARDRATNSDWDEAKGCAISQEDKELAEINKDDSISWLIETPEKSKVEKVPQDVNAENFKKFLEANNKSHFDFNRIMDDSSIGSLLNASNGPRAKAASAISYAPGVNLDEQAKRGLPRVSNDSDSISDLSSKGSTAKSIFTRIDSNEQKLEKIGNLLETLMKNLENKGDNHDRPREPASCSQGTTSPAREGRSL